MDNDNKITIQKPEVRLFLQGNVSPLTSDKPSMYNLETEYAKTKKNKSPYVVLLMIGSIVAVALLAWGVTRYIDYGNENIEVGIDVFEDLNLKNLLNMVSRTEDSIKALSTQKSKLEVSRDAEIEQLTTQKDIDIYAIDSLKIKKKDKTSRKATVERQYNTDVANINAKYNPEISELDKQIVDLQAQLAQLDSNQALRDDEKKAAIDSERQVFEMEKSQLINQYETTIKDLQAKLFEKQQSSYIQQKETIDQVNENYGEYLDTIDPVMADEDAESIFSAVKEYGEVTKYNAEDFVNEGTTTEFNGIVEEAQYAFDSYDYIVNQIMEIPFENSVPEYVQSMSDIAHLIGQQLSAVSSNAMLIMKQTEKQLREDYEAQLTTKNSAILEKDALIQSQTLTLEQNNQTITEQQLQIEELQKSVKEFSAHYLSTEDLQKEILAMETQVTELKKDEEMLNGMLSYFNTLSRQNGDSGYVLDIQNQNKLLVYVSPLYADNIQGVKGYVFRKADELIGTVNLVKEGKYTFAIPDSNAIGKILPDDRILLQMISK